MTFIEISDLSPFATIATDKANAMIADAEAMAVLVAPCITSDGFAQGAAVKAILRAALLRWNEAGTGALSAQAAGPFSQSIDTTQPRKGMFWPSEIEQLQSLCSDLGGNVYMTSMAGPDADGLPWLGWGWSEVG